MLVAEKNQKGAFISRVEDGSPAAAGGLRSGDRLIEVNGVNVEEETHPGITSRILAVPGCLELLVVDDVSDR